MQMIRLMIHAKYVSFVEDLHEKSKQPNCTFFPLGLVFSAFFGGGGGWGAAVGPGAGASALGCSVMPCSERLHFLSSTTERPSFCTSSVHVPTGFSSQWMTWNEMVGQIMLPSDAT